MIEFIFEGALLSELEPVHHLAVLFQQHVLRKFAVQAEIKHSFNECHLVSTAPRQAMPFSINLVQEDFLLVEDGQVSYLIFVRCNLLVCYYIYGLLVVDARRAQIAHTLARQVELGTNAVLKSFVQVQQDWTFEVS